MGCSAAWARHWSASGGSRKRHRHELRTPLTVLRGRLESARSPAEDRSIGEDLTAAIEEVRRIDSLVESLLILARSDAAPIPMAPVNLCDVAREAARSRAKLDGAGSPAPEVLASDEILVRGSEELLARVLDNLLENARKFAGPLANVRVHVGEEGDDVVLRVEDDGPGMAPQHRARAFERFFRSPADRSRVPGTGLGLAVVLSIVKRHGGHGSVRARPSWVERRSWCISPSTGPQAEARSRPSSREASAGSPEARASARRRRRPRARRPTRGRG